jgi:hypothetical protein
MKVMLRDLKRRTFLIVSLRREGFVSVSCALVSHSLFLTNIMYGKTIPYMDCSYKKIENDPLYVGQQNITLHRVYLHRITIAKNVVI